MNRRRILWLAIGTVLLGALVLALNPDYRATLAGLLRNRPADTPIWESNSRYYPDIRP